MPNGADRGGNSKPGNESPDDLPRQVLDGLLEGCQVISPEYRYLYVNHAAAAHGRTTRDQLVGRTMMEAYPGIEETEMFSILRRCMDDRALQRMGNEFTFPDGSKGWFELRFEPVPAGVAVLSLDITSHKRAEVNAVHLSALLRGIRNVNRLIATEQEPQTLLRKACELLVESRAFATSCIVLCDGDRVTSRTDAGMEFELPALRGMMVGGKLPDCVDRMIQEADLAVRRSPTSPGIGRRVVDDCPDGQDAVAVRLESDGKASGALLVAFPAGHVCGEEELELLRAVASDLAFALRGIELRVGYGKAEETLALFRSLVDQSNDAIEVIDPCSGRILDVNERACLDLGYSREEYCRLTIFDIDPMVDEATFESAEVRIREAGSMTWEGAHRRKDGSVFPVEVGIRYVELERAYLVAVARDITHRRKAEEALVRSRDMEAAIAAVLELSLEDLPLDELLQEVLDKVLSIPWLSVERKGAILLVEDDPDVLVLQAGIGLADDLEDCCSRVRFGVCLCGRAASSRQLIHAGQLDARHEHTYDGMGPHGHYCVPILHAGEVLGVLNAYVPHGHAYVQHEAEFLTAVANTLAGIIVRRQSEHARVRIEGQLRLARRLEAVGRLAGGVAHDFNNLLTVITSYAGFALEELHESDPIRDDLAEVQNAAQRATALTRQLLAFSRKQILEPQVLSLNEVVKGLEGMLRRILGEDIDIVVHLADELGSAEADPGQLEQVIMNLAINARDAMPAGGMLTIETANVELEEGPPDERGDLKSGRYVMLAVTDNGSGMDTQTRKHVFEPFFTTKDKGTGTGLGLATVYGIVTQSGGSISVYSEVGHGTVFKIYLPRVDAAPVKIMPRPVSLVPTGSETVLLVEDEAAVRRLAERILRKAGYRVLVAANGGEALLLCEKLGDDIDLLLTDVVMPRMSGRELADRLVKVSPGLRTLYMSGYTDDAIAHHGVLDAGTRFISKPFSAADLTRKVREVLDD